MSDSVAIANGAIELEEEESTNISAGLVFSLGDYADITADYFHIEVDDRITLTEGSTDNVTFFANLVDTETDGFDIVATGAVEVGSGAIDWQVLYSYAETDVKNPSVIGEEELNTLDAPGPLIVKGRPLHAEGSAQPFTFALRQGMGEAFQAVQRTHYRLRLIKGRPRSSNQGSRMVN